jgi:hypothetical protein
MRRMLFSIAVLLSAFPPLRGFAETSVKNVDIVQEKEDDRTSGPFESWRPPRCPPGGHEFKKESDGTRLIFPLLNTGQVVMLDISNPDYPFVLDVVNLGLGSEPHVAGLTEDDKRLVVTDYFLNEDDFGKLHFEGDHKVHVLRVQRGRLEIDYRFNLNFNTAMAASRPHGIAIK